jgi:hypothetical protein
LKTEIRFLNLAAEYSQRSNDPVTVLQLQGDDPA